MGPINVDPNSVARVLANVKERLQDLPLTPLPPGSHPSLDELLQSVDKYVNGAKQYFIETNQNYEYKMEAVTALAQTHGFIDEDTDEELVADQLKELFTGVMLIDFMETDLWHRCFNEHDVMMLNDFYAFLQQYETPLQ